MPRVERVRACIAPRVTRFRSFRGKPSNRQEQLELDVESVKQLRQRLVGRPVCYNHDDTVVVGSISSDAFEEAPDGTGRWYAYLDISDETPEGAQTLKHVREGHVRGVSLKHLWSSNRPIEVSICAAGARGPDSCIVRDSKTGQYTSVVRDDPVIAASDIDAHAESIDVTILDVVAASIVMPDAAPVATAGGVPPTAAQLGATEEKTGTDAPTAPAGAATDDDGGEEKKQDADDPKASSDDIDLADMPTLKSVVENMPANGIPTRAQKDAMQQKAVEADLALKDALIARAQAEAEAARVKKELEHAQQELSKSKRMLDQGDRMIADVAVNAMAGAFGKEEDKAVLASASPEVRKALANIAYGVQRAAADAPLISEAARKQVAQWRLTNNAAAKKKKGAPPQTPSETKRIPSLTDPDTPVFASALGAGSNMFAGWRATSSNSAMVDDDAADDPVVAASRAFDSAARGPQPGQPGWGEPIERPCFEMTVAASAGRRPLAHEYARAKGDFEKYAKPVEPGFGANFNHRFYTLPQQRDVWVAFGEQYGTFDSVPKSSRLIDMFSNEYIAEHNRTRKQRLETYSAEERQRWCGPASGIGAYNGEVGADPSFAAVNVNLMRP